jgi:cbb3-type cytochrome oxidase maturation protein
MFLTWLFLVGFSVWLGLLTFFWALQDGQFSDQDRARYLPFADEPDRPASGSPSWKGGERYLFLCLGLVVMFIFGAAFYLGAAG